MSAMQHKQPLGRAEPAHCLVSLEATASMPTRHGRFQCYVFRAHDSGTVHIALVLGKVEGRRAVLTRLHSECLTGDVFGSCRCDCGEQLDAALGNISAQGCGVLLYMRDHEGRGIGLANKIRAYALQEQGRDTVEANLDLGLPVDTRDYRAAAAMLSWLSVQSVCVMTNNPEKLETLASQGIVVARRIPLQPPSRPENEFYIRTKRTKLGHFPPDRPLHAANSESQTPAH